MAISCWTVELSVISMITLSAATSARFSARSSIGRNPDQPVYGGHVDAETKIRRARSVAAKSRRTWRTTSLVMALTNPSSSAILMNISGPPQSHLRRSSAQRLGPQSVRWQGSHLLILHPQCVFANRPAKLLLNAAIAPVEKATIKPRNPPVTPPIQSRPSVRCGWPAALRTLEERRDANVC